MSLKIYLKSYCREDFLIFELMIRQRFAGRSRRYNTNLEISMVVVSVCRLKSLHYNKRTSKFRKWHCRKSSILNLVARNKIIPQSIRRTMPHYGSHIHESVLQSETQANISTVTTITRLNSTERSSIVNNKSLQI